MKIFIFVSFYFSFLPNKEAKVAQMGPSVSVQSRSNIVRNAQRAPQIPNPLFFCWFFFFLPQKVMSASEMDRDCPKSCISLVAQMPQQQILLQQNLWKENTKFFFPWDPRCTEGGYCKQFSFLASKCNNFIPILGKLTTI